MHQPGQRGILDNAAAAATTAGTGQSQGLLPLCDDLRFSSSPPLHPPALLGATGEREQQQRPVTTTTTT